jgi:lipooligosaccharide transport system ATP-binding protein
MAATGEAAPVVAVEGVEKRFGERVAVAGVDFAVERGACFGLLGPNGAGKTTTLRMIYGVTRPSAGRVRVFGIDVARDPRAVRARVGVTLQENVLLETGTPRENLAVHGRYYLLREPELSRRIDELIELFGLQSYAATPVKALSGGYKRRLAVAMSLIARPELLILDEPTTGLDPAVRHELWGRVRALRAEGTTVLLTTHYMDEAERLCDRVVIIDRGRAICDDVPRALIAARLAPEAIEFDCTPEEEARWFGAVGPEVRRVRAGNRLMLYAANAAALVERVHAEGGARRTFIARPTNLEDVFLTVTGTRLSDDA